MLKSPSNQEFYRLQETDGRHLNLKWQRQMGQKNNEQRNGYTLSRQWFNFTFDSNERITPIHTALFEVHKMYKEETGSVPDIKTVEHEIKLVEEIDVAIAFDELKDYIFWLEEKVLAMIRAKSTIKGTRYADEEDEELSECCTAPLVNHDICSECWEYI